GGTGPRRGIDLTSNRALSEVLDEGLELNSRK
ncbi:antitoxin VapB31, partial [Mycobacterium tuberculosis TB_RSA113]